MNRPTALVALLCFGGCSFVNVRGPGEVTDPPREYHTCTQESMDPFIDIGLGLLTALSVGAALSQNKTTTSSSTTGAEAVNFVWPAIFGLSAWYGFSRISECKDHHAAWARAHPESPNGPPMYMYPPPGYGYPPPGYGAPPPQQQPPAAAPGAEGGSCGPTVTCGQGLVCASEICVRPPDPPR